MYKKAGLDNVVVAQIAMVLYTIAIMGLILLNYFGAAFCMLGVSYCALKYRVYKKSQKPQISLTTE